MEDHASEDLVVTLEEGTKGLFTEETASVETHFPEHALSLTELSRLVFAAEGK